MQEWVPLMDYAMKKGVSLSTLRRHIKAKKIPYRIENGKYLLLLDGDDDGAGVSYAPDTDSVDRALVENFGLSHRMGQQAREFALAVFDRETESRDESRQAIALQQQVQRLTQDLQKAHEEIAELKTLIAFYEDKMFAQRMDV